MVAAQVVVGIDVGKRFHHACAIDGDGTVLLSRRVLNTEAELRRLFADVAELDREATYVIDVLSEISALVMAVSAATDAELRYVTGAAVHSLSRIFVGEGKTDARDARVIAEAGRINHQLRRVEPQDETIAALAALTGYRSDLAVLT